MNETCLSTKRTYQPGDRVTLTVEIETAAGAAILARVVGYDGNCRTILAPAELDAGKLEPRPIKVGDEVHFSGGPTLVVRATDNDVAWVLYPNGVYSTLPVFKLTRVAPKA